MDTIIKIRIFILISDYYNWLLYNRIMSLNIQKKHIIFIQNNIWKYGITIKWTNFYANLIQK